MLCIFFHNLNLRINKWSMFFVLNFIVWVTSPAQWIALRVMCGPLLASPFPLPVHLSKITHDYHLSECYPPCFLETLWSSDLLNCMPSFTAQRYCYHIFIERINGFQYSIRYFIRSSRWNTEFKMSNSFLVQVYTLKYLRHAYVNFCLLRIHIWLDICIFDKPDNGL